VVGSGRETGGHEASPRRGTPTARSDVDLHFWLDPERMSTLAAEVSVTLRGRPRRRSHEANLASAVGNSGSLRLWSTPWWCHDIRLPEVRPALQAHLGAVPGAGPSAARLTGLADLVEQEEVTVVFSETLASPALAETLARDLGVETGVLDPIEGLGDATADEDYLSLMRTNLDELRTANRCR
jgi:zinc transport system substrate-binding protein